MDKTKNPFGLLNQDPEQVKMAQDLAVEKLKQAQMTPEQLAYYNFQAAHQADPRQLAVQQAPTPTPQEAALMAIKERAARDNFNKLMPQTAQPDMSGAYDIINKDSENEKEEMRRLATQKPQ